MVMAVNVLYIDGVHEIYRCRISSFVLFFCCVTELLRLSISL